MWREYVPWCQRAQEAAWPCNYTMLTQREHLVSPPHNWHLFSAPPLAKQNSFKVREIQTGLKEVPEVKLLFFLRGMGEGRRFPREVQCLAWSWIFNSQSCVVPPDGALWHPASVEAGCLGHASNTALGLQSLSVRISNDCGNCLHVLDSHTWRSCRVGGRLSMDSSEWWWRILNIAWLCCLAGDCWAQVLKWRAIAGRKWRASALPFERWMRSLQLWKCMFFSWRGTPQMFLMLTTQLTSKQLH